MKAVSPIRQPEDPDKIRRQPRPHVVAELALQLRQRRVVVDEDDLFQVHEGRVGVLARVAWGGGGGNMKLFHVNTTS